MSFGFNLQQKSSGRARKGGVGRKRRGGLVGCIGTEEGEEIGGWGGGEGI